MARLEHEIKPVLMRWGRLAKRRWLVKVLDVFALNSFTKQFLSQTPWFVINKGAKKFIMLMQALDLLQRRHVGLILIKHTLWW